LIERIKDELEINQHGSGFRPFLPGILASVFSDELSARFLSRFSALDGVTNHLFLGAGGGIWCHYLVVVGGFQKS
jgi:hypothetical protein